LRGALPRRATKQSREDETKGNNYEIASLLITK
jgi:hypothetical protein